MVRIGRIVVTCGDHTGYRRDEYGVLDHVVILPTRGIELGFELIDTLACATADFKQLYSPVILALGIVESHLELVNIYIVEGNYFLACHNVRADINQYAFYTVGG